MKTEKHWISIANRLPALKKVVEITDGNHTCTGMIMMIDIDNDTMESIPIWKINGDVEYWRITHWREHEE